MTKFLRRTRGSFLLDAMMAFGFGAIVLAGATYIAPFGRAAIDDSENETLAHWLAANVVNETMARQTFPKVGTTVDFGVEFAGYSGWAVEKKVNAGAWATVRNFTVRVFKLPEGQVVKRIPENAFAIATLEAFLRDPKKRTKANSAVPGIPGP